MTAALTTISSASLPVAYRDAVKALERCQTIDEAKEWRDKAEAIAGYARLAKDESALVAAMRFAAHCTRRMGELLAEIPTEQGKRSDLTSSGRPKEVVTQKDVAERAGLYRAPKVQAAREAVSWLEHIIARLEKL